MNNQDHFVRLNAFISQSGITSRRKADDLISAGKIKVNGKTITELGTKIDPIKDKIEFENKQITPPKHLTYLAIYKPKGIISTLHDEENRPCMKDLIPPNLESKNLRPVGRLDKDSEGLMLLTDDNQFINELTHPKFEKEKAYLVKINKPLKLSQRNQLEEGIIIETEEGAFKTRPCRIHLSPSHLHITLKEGRKRQIRKMFQQLDITVIYLQRMRIGKLVLGKPPIENLTPGQGILINKNAI